MRSTELVKLFENNPNNGQVKVWNETEIGGAANFNREHNVWASYGTALNNGVPLEALFAGVGLKSGQTIHFCVNREFGIITIDLEEKDGSRKQIMRTMINDKN